MTNEEKKTAVLKSAVEEIEKRELGGRQAMLTLKLAAVINKFFDRHPDVKLELTCVILDTLTEQMCVAVYDDAEMDGRVERVSQVTIQ